jgi:hypothetical protein
MAANVPSTKGFHKLKTSGNSNKRPSSQTIS